MSAFLVSGRSLKNFRANRHEVPGGSVIVPCIACQDSVAISPEGARKLAEARTRGDFFCGAICTPCVLALPRLTEVQATKAGAELVERSESAKEIVDVLLKRAERG